MPSSPEQPFSGNPQKKEKRLDAAETLKEITFLADRKLSPRRKHWKRGESVSSKPKTAEETVSELEREWAYWQDKNKREDEE